MIVTDTRLLQAKDLVKSDIDSALKLINDVLNDEPENPQALFMAGYILMSDEKWGLAYSLYKRCEELYPPYSEVYNNMGMCLEFIDHEKALVCFDKAIDLDPSNAMAVANKGLIYSYMGQPEKCIELSTKAIEINPDFDGAIHNRSYSNLMLRNWKIGWEEYRYSLGSAARSGRDYGVPDWDGFRPGNVVVYRDQGLGDEIFFASCVEDAKKYANIILDVSPRLEGLFKSSFDVPVYGTGFENETDLVHDYKIDYQCSLGDLPRFYRNTDESFPGKPYLKPNQSLVNKYKNRVKKYKGLKIGIAWTGGLTNTHSKARCVTLDDLKPILNMDATFFSLEYNEPNKLDLRRNGIIHYSDAVNKSVDHEETSAFISNLDLVISVTTTVIHTAGGLGVNTYCLTPKWPSWRFHLEGDFPWNKSVELFRQKPDEDWANTINRLAEVINEQDIYRNRHEATCSVSRTVQLDPTPCYGAS